MGTRPAAALELWLGIGQWPGPFRLEWHEPCPGAGPAGARPPSDSDPPAWPWVVAFKLILQVARCSWVLPPRQEESESSAAASLTSWSCQWCPRRHCPCCRCEHVVVTSYSNPYSQLTHLHVVVNSPISYSHWQTAQPWLTANYCNVVTLRQAQAAWQCDVWGNIRVNFKPIRAGRHTELGPGPPGTSRLPKHFLWLVRPVHFIFAIYSCYFGELPNYYICFRKSCSVWMK